MRRDWEVHREALLSFWRSGKYSTTDELAEFGLNIRMPPWLYVRGSPGPLPWAAKRFDAPSKAGKLKRVDSIHTESA